MQQYTIHIPVKYNDGLLVAAETINDVIIGTALDTFGGYSYDPTRIMGGWKDDSTGKVYEEEMTRITIATNNSKELGDYAEFLKKVLDQEAMYVVKSGNVIFV